MKNLSLLSLGEDDYVVVVCRPEDTHVQLLQNVVLIGRTAYYTI